MPALPGPGCLGDVPGQEAEVGIDNLGGGKVVGQALEAEVVGAAQIGVQDAECDGGLAGERLVDDTGADVKCFAQEMCGWCVVGGNRVVAEGDDGVALLEGGANAFEHGAGLVNEKVFATGEFGLALAVDDAHVLAGVGGHGGADFGGSDTPGGDTGLAKHDAEGVVVVAVGDENEAAGLLQCSECVGGIDVDATLNPLRVFAVIGKNFAPKDAVTGEPLVGGQGGLGVGFAESGGDGALDFSAVHAVGGGLFA